MLRHRIGLTYLPGTLPCFETFGNLPTDIVQGNGCVGGKPASKVLDMIIIPGGSLVESQTVTDNLANEVQKMADEGKFVLGVCSGFQILSKGTDVGRLSITPIMRGGMGLLDVEFSPLVCTDQVKATVVNRSYLTDEIGKEVAGFHCHTYGNIILGKEATPILVSHTKRLNYHTDARELVAGITNKEGNVVGIILHALIDRNPLVIKSIVTSLDITSAELAEIRTANARLLKQISREVGILTGIRSQTRKTPKAGTPCFLLVTALGSGTGKTFIVTGIASVLKKRGFKVGVLKIGGDIRDTVPALYMIKEPMRTYASIRIGESGWLSVSDAVKAAGKDYDFVVIEGAMSAFTGLLNENIVRPCSTAEVGAALGVPAIVVVGSDKEGIEGAMVSSLNYIRLLKNLGVKVKGVILNKVHTSYLTQEVKKTIEEAFACVGVELVGIVPRMNLEGRGVIPEIEIKYEEFGAKALETAEVSLNTEKIAAMAEPSSVSDLDYHAFLIKFKNSLIADFKPDTDGG